jgi:hypothetical protein
MSFGVPLPESESEFPSYPHYPQGAQILALCLFQRGLEAPHEEWEQILLVETPDVDHRSPDSGDLQYTSRRLKTAI